ncbi:hypothetical protein K503DRAFT_72060 [Rhizopogon vinicolor AM-OR11-026]|uniref:Uncharacterized protein n=1 Tax=Rhizopogon vinicolor AM-OR11-026 TaxID=1314800 RepID=A0A1B7MG56_9AGAM|nr:hypothetical protein K503DRAFT_72060 [Rhizopogon vinicolor AM-OR11-026]
MSTWQNLPSLSHMYGDKRKRLNSEKRNCTVQNLFGRTLACYVLLQLIIFLIALSFAIYVHITGPVMLQSAAATFAHGQPHIMSYVITLTATVMSFLNTLLLSLVLQVALKARMGRPMSLQVFRG